MSDPSVTSISQQRLDLSAMSLHMNVTQKQNCTLHEWQIDSTCRGVKRIKSKKVSIYVADKMDALLDDDFFFLPLSVQAVPFLLQCDFHSLSAMPLKEYQ